MEGALATTTEYAKERQQYGVPIGSFQAVQHLLAEARVPAGGLDQRVAVRGVGGRCAAGRRRLQAGAVAKAYCAQRRAHRVRDRDPGARRHRQHVGVLRARAPAARLAVDRLFGDEGHHLRDARAASRVGRRPWTSMTRPQEAEFRARFRAWLVDNNPGLPASSTDDEYWAKQAEWHCALFDGGFFALTWPKRYGGQELPPVYEVIVDEELAAAGAPPKPGLGYLIQGITRHGSDEICERFLPGTDQRPRPLVPGLQRTGRRVRPRVAAHARGARRRRVRHRGSQDLDQLLRRRRLVHAPRPHRSRRAEAQGHLRVRGADATSPGSNSGH